MNNYSPIAKFNTLFQPKLVFFIFTLFASGYDSVHAGLTAKEESFISENYARVVAEQEYYSDISIYPRKSLTYFGSLPESPANPSYSIEAESSSNATFIMTFWREKLSSIFWFPLLRITPTGTEAPFICGPSFGASTIEEGLPRYYETIKLHTGNNSSFCGDLLGPATFIFDQWDHLDKFNPDEAFVLRHDGYRTITELNIPSLDGLFIDETEDLPEVLNISTRAQILGGADNPVAGFVIGGKGTQEVVVTAKGKGIKMPEELVCQDTAIRVFKMDSGAWNEIAYNDDWVMDSRASEIPEKFRPDDTSDAALLRDFESGTYSAIMSCKVATGIGLIGVNVVD